MSTLRLTFGEWALVTGASSGIGEEFCRQIAKAGLNIVMIARRKERLQKLSTELSSQYGVDTRIITQDLSEEGAVNQIGKITSELDIGLVVSNAGDGAMGGFLKREAHEFERALKLNLLTPVGLIHHYLEKMQYRHGKSGLLLVSSGVAVTGAPYIGDYSATKAYQLHLGQALHHELKGSGIHVSVLMPGPTKTEVYQRDDIDFNKMPIPPMSVSRVVRTALTGVEVNKIVVIPGFMNKLMDFFARRIMSRNISSFMFGLMMKHLVPDKYRYDKVAHLNSNA